MPPSFHKRLSTQSTYLLILLLLAFTLGLLSIGWILILGFEALNQFSAWQESSALYVMLALSGVTAVALLIGWARIITQRPTQASLALAIENQHPELMESLTCATELQEKNGGPQNALEEALFRQVETTTAEIPFAKTILRKRLPPFLLALLGVGFFSFGYLALQTQFAQKAKAHFTDSLQGKNTGLLVSPGNAEMPIDSDLTIEAQIQRWAYDAHIEYQEAGTSEIYPMSVDAEGKADFTFYGLQGDIRYRVSTSSLRSPWYRITTFHPPKLESIDIQITPPTYTGEAPRQFAKLLDLYLTEGSQLAFQFEVAEGVTGELLLNDVPTPLTTQTTNEAQTASNSRLGTTLQPLRDARYQIRLQDSEGHTFVSEAFELEVIPDEPPVVEFITPGKDIEAKPDEHVPLEIYAADDYGISRVEVEISVSGLDRSPLLIFAQEDSTLREENFLSALEPDQLGVEIGDVIAYHALVWDNKKPTPQLVHSEVFFVEITSELPEADPLEMPGGGEGQQEEEIDLRALIVELKRIVRETHRTQYLTGEARELSNSETGAALAELHREATQILNKAGNQLMQTNDGQQVLQMFSDSINRIKEAEELINANAPESALSLEQESLSAWVKLEMFFKAQQPPSQGEGQGQSDQKSEGSESNESQEPEEKSMSLAQMQQALENINQLVDQQSEMNARFKRAQQSSPGKAEREELSDLQKEVAQKARELQNTLKPFKQNRGITDQLKGAQQEMRQASSAAQQNEIGQAGRSGGRAKESLLGASSLMDDMIRQAASQALSQLGQQAGSLAAGEKAAAAQSRQAANDSDVSAEALQEAQDQLLEEFQRLQAQTNQTAAEMQEVFPEVARMLSEVARQAEAQNIDNAMTKASNALLYENFDRAARQQDKATAGLEGLAEGLQQTANALPAMSPTELRNLLEDVLAAREESAIQESQGKESGQSPGEAGAPGKEGQSGQEGEGSKGQPKQNGSSPGQNIGRRIQEAGQALKNKEITKLGSELTASQTEGNGTGGTASSQLLDKSARLLQKYLRTQLINERARLNRTSGTPPEKYRRLIEEYFKKLAEE